MAAEKLLNPTETMRTSRDVAVYARMPKDFAILDNVAQFELLCDGEQPVLCGAAQPNGRSGCNGILGHVLPWNPCLGPDVTEDYMEQFGIVVSTEEEGLFELTQTPHLHACLRILRFPSGWRKGEDGMWAESKRARENASRGRRAYRRPPGADTGLGHPSVRFQHPDHYPCVVRCTACGKPNVLDPKRLKLVVYYHDVGRLCSSIWEPWMSNGGITIEDARTRNWKGRDNSFEQHSEWYAPEGTPGGKYANYRQMHQYTHMQLGASATQNEINLWRAVDKWLSHAPGKLCYRFDKDWGEAVVRAERTNEDELAYLSRLCRKYGIRA
jgi:hypothetical protein